MPMSGNASSTSAIHRKLRALTAVLLDRATTEHERANAEGLKMRLEEQLRREATPGSIMFRLGRGVREIITQPSPNGDWTDHAFRVGRMLRGRLKK
jgi:squalene cyclase